MKAASGPLIAYLNSGGVFLMADLLTITLQGGGTAYRWTNSDQSLTVSSNTFSPAVDQGGVPLFQRGTVRTVRGLEVDVMDLTLFTGDTAQILGVNLPLAAHNGALDGARVRLERLFMPTFGDVSLGTLVLFEGNVAGVDPATQQVVIHAKSDLEILQNQMPRMLFAPNCANAFGDAGCGVNTAGLTVAGTAGAGTNASQVTGVTGHADGYFNLGVIAMTSGAASGSRRAVKSYLSGVVVPSLPFPQAPAAGDTFTTYPGCGRTLAACQGWGNQNRFRGCPFIPVPETAL